SSAPCRRPDGLRQARRPWLRGICSSMQRIPPTGSPDQTMDVDVIVAGSGSAGMTTAIVAAKSGLKVLLVEKTRYFGGTTALSGGGCWIPNNHQMGSIGASDTP